MLQLSLNPTTDWFSITPTRWEKDLKYIHMDVWNIKSSHINLIPLIEPYDAYCYQVEIVAINAFDLSLC